MAFRHDFRHVTGRDGLLIALGIDDFLLDAVLDFVPSPPEPSSDASISVLHVPLFIRHDIPKRNRARGRRVVWEPTLAKTEFKTLGRRLDSFFRLAIGPYPHDAVYGYRPGRNIRENAAAHAGHRLLLSVDVQDFFPSISTDRVRRLFSDHGVKEQVADLLARFVTIGGALPLGLPSSPVISNAVALPIDLELADLAGRSGCTYTRYADDLSFSGEERLPDVERIRAILADHGFAIADAKTRRSVIGRAHFVTGLSVSDPVRPHVPRSRKRALRQELHYAGKYGLEDHLRRRGVNDPRVIQRNVNRIDGMVRFVAHHEPRLASGLVETWSAIKRDSGMKPSFGPSSGRHRSPFYLFVDEAELASPDGPRLALGMAVTQHGAQLFNESGEVLEAALSDIFAAGDRDALLKRGLHFVDATEDLRLAYVNRLASMRFEGYVAYCRMGAPADYQSDYLRLLAALITRRLKTAESRFAFLYFERNGKVAEEAIRAVVQRSFDDLKARDDRRPDAIGVEFVSKPNLAMSAPDFLLGVLGRYLRSRPPPEGRPEPRDRLLFERLRDRYRLILDVDGWVEYSRRRPIEPWPVG